MYLNLLKKKEKRKQKELYNLKSKIKLEELKENRGKSKITLNLKKINETKSENRSTRNKSMMYPNANMNMNTDSDKPHPLYTSILNSRKGSNENIHRSHGQVRHQSLSVTVKKIRKRVSSLMKSKQKAKLRDKILGGLVNTYAE